MHAARLGKDHGEGMASPCRPVADTGAVSKTCSGQGTSIILSFSHVVVQMAGKVFNGFDVEIVGALIEGVKKQPEMGKAILSANVNWKTGFFTEGLVKDFIAGGMKFDKSRSKPFVILQDHPPEMGGGANRAATAGELLLVTLGHCITSTIASSATMLGIQIESLRTEIEGHLDMQGMLGLPQPGVVRPGFLEVKARYYIKSNAPREQLEKAAKMGEDFSVVKDSMRAVKFSSQLFVE